MRLVVWFDGEALLIASTRLGQCGANSGKLDMLRYNPATMVRILSAVPRRVGLGAQHYTTLCQSWFTL